MTKRANRIMGASTRPRSGSPLDGRGPGTCDASATSTNKANQIFDEELTRPAIESGARRRNGRQGASNRKGRAVDRYWTVPQLAELLLVCDQTVRRWIQREQLVAHEFVGAIRIAEHDVCNFIEQARRGGTARVHPCDDSFYTAADVAEILNLCLRTIRRHIDAKALIKHDFHGTIRISESDLHDYCARSRRK